MNLKVQNLSVLRGQKPVLKDLSFSIEKPQLIGLIGPNGAGKSTLMRAIAGLQIYQGEISLADLSLSSFAPKELAQKMAYLPQERAVHWPMPCNEVVKLGRLPYLSGFSRLSEHDQQIVNETMQALDVADFAYTSFDNLSGGEQARVLIARVLAQQPQLIIADEPVNGLDPAHQISLMQTFKQLVAQGKTVLTSLHDLSLASQWCDRILMLEAGRLVADGPATEVMTAENIRNVYRVESAQMHHAGREILIPTDLLSNTSPPVSKGEKNAG